VGGGWPVTGLAIIAAVGLGASGLAAEPWWAAFAVGAAAIAAVSWFDDVRRAGTLTRLGVHTLAAVALVATVAGLAPGSPFDHGVIAVAAVVWIVGVTNAYNFMDGVDGIAGAHAIVSGLGWMWFGWTTGHPLAAALGAVVAGAAAGFLPFNWQPARIFMGDVGAAPIGFTLAALVVVTGADGWSVAAAGALCLWPFLFDTGHTLCRRLLRGENILQAHRSHLYQRLVRSGWSHRRTSTLYAACASAGWAMAPAVRDGGAGARVLVGVAVAAMCIALWAFIRYHRERSASRFRLTIR
jgi:UDP-N-acetylmuramyl pentapeptide phosphotransferase/UDP-N-acetylglucosamine-1-phosphate transferase